ncbi:MAG: M20 family metallopeptidase [Oscillospiraceae bacterium]|nr:M20 family metallopeptidase [Oscillospiraceae bacterium]
MRELHPAVKLTQQLIQIDSQNPATGEKEIIRFIGDWLAEGGVPYRLQEVEKDRSNLIVEIKGGNKRPPIIFIAHTDTVPIGEGWQENPLGGEIRGGKIYGRGSADMKGGLAGALYAARMVHNERGLPGDLIVVASVDEEGPGMIGIKALLDAGIVGKDSLVISPEPTSLEIVRAHRGLVWYEIVTGGVSVHAGHAERGVDANHALAEVLSEIKTAVAALPFYHPLLKQPLVSIGQMRGGEKTNVVPNTARAEIDFRIVPPLTATLANRMIKSCAERAVKRVPGSTVIVSNLGLERAPIIIDENAQIIRHLTQSCRKVLGKDPAHAGYVAYTDAATVSLFTGNQNAICFGPGNLEQGHTLDEWAPVDEIEKCAEIFLALCKGE